MTVSTADVLASSTSLSEFTAATTPPDAMPPAAPARPAAQASPVQGVRTERAVSTKRRRRGRVDWYQVAVILLILASGALGIYRLAWAMQP